MKLIIELSLNDYLLELIFINDENEKEKKEFIINLLSETIKELANIVRIVSFKENLIIAYNYTNNQTHAFNDFLEKIKLIKNYQFFLLESVIPVNDVVGKDGKSITKLLKSLK